MPATHTATAPQILLTGATGQVGHELVRELAPLGRVHAPGRNELDLASVESIRDAVRRLRPTLVVNAGAYTAVDRAESDVALCEAINSTAPRVLAEELARIGGALVHYSTDYVFDGTGATPYTETDPPNPLSTYGATKLAGEQGVAATGVAHLIFRTSWVYGARGHNFLRTILRLGREREELRIVADQVGAPTWSRTIAGVTALVLAQLAAGPRGLVEEMQDAGGVYHLTAGGATSWHGFAEAILRADPCPGEQRCRAVVPIATAEYPTPARRPRNSLLDNQKLRSRFGVRQVPWDEALALVLPADGGSR